MKRAIVIVAVVFSWALLAGAQTTANTIRANVPFAFQLNQKEMPAGEYDFRWSLSRIVTVKPVNGQVVQLMMANQIDEFATPDNAKIMFRKAGDLYFLAQISSHAGIVVMKMTPTERRIMLAGKPSETVSVEGK